MRDKILIVDDLELNREILIDIIKDDYSILEAENGKVALEIIQKHKDRLAAILLDLVMPEMSGFEVLEILKRRKIMSEIPVLIITGEKNIEVEKRCFDCGVTDFIRKPFDNTLVKKRVDNLSKLFIYKSRLEDQIEIQTDTIKKQYQLLQAQMVKLKKRNENIIDILGTVVEYRSLESGEHIQHVKGYTKIMGEKFIEVYPESGLTHDQLEIIVSASALHDIGKVAIPDNILLKPGRLTPEEFECMKTHTTKGCEILESIKDVWDEQYSKVSYEICRYHHERYDGKGYPDGLSGEEIPLSAQLVSVADVYDALVNKRCYKSAFPKDEAYQMIMDSECGTFSPRLLKVLSLVRKDFEALSDKIITEREKERIAL